MTKSFHGVKNGELAACPKSPNCVSTQETDEEKRLEPLPFNGDLEETKTYVRQILNQMDRTTIEVEDGNYFHVISKTKLIGFKDDVEFYFDQDAQLVHFRSASRVGYSDLGANRKRMETFSELYLSHKKGEMSS
ncbi:DUF1499 domain-containing protein [Halobacillus yeomjeoni]|uniref:DUF1499 domain-containing protein n=1 Tax=Halobacillus yeomjeoni TaxID=311194 RepID=UPI001CD37258|nr:DUF1499 domain-containing protein [Halobacillus yeomjeoni]MCA0983954.1 DUF1499 domain-containing protein [Halobacillus yeomjeoni]